MKTMKLMALLVVAFSVNAASASSGSTCKVAKDAELKAKAEREANAVFRRSPKDVSGKSNGIT